MAEGFKRLPAAFFRQVGGREPVREWLKELGLQRIARSLVATSVVPQFAWPVGLPLCRSLGGGLWEVPSSLTGREDRSGGLSARMKAMRCFCCMASSEIAAEDAACRPRRGTPAHAGGEGHDRPHPHIGSSFESFLDEEGILEERTATAIKRVLARQIERAMHERGLTKSAMAKAMRTSRPQLDRLLDPANPSVTLDTLQRAAAAVGRNLCPSWPDWASPCAGLDRRGQLFCRHPLSAGGGTRPAPTQPTAVLDALDGIGLDDFDLALNGDPHPDGGLIHDMYLVEVKKPAEVTEQKGFLKPRATVPAPQAFGPYAE